MMQTTGQQDAAPPGEAAMAVLAFGPFRLSMATRSLWWQHNTVPLGARAFDILALLVRRAGQVVRHDELTAHVWADIQVSAGTPRVHLAALRKALGCRPGGPRYIATIPGRGYCFVAPVVAADLHHAAPRDLHPQPSTSRSATQGGADPGYTGAPGPAGVAAPPKPLRSPNAAGISRNAAEQRLTTPNTTPAAIAGSIGFGPDLEPVSGPSGVRGASDGQRTPGVEELEMNRRKLAVSAALTVLSGIAADAELSVVRAQTPDQGSGIVTHYRTAKVDGIEVFWREAGPVHAPVVLLLHGFPTSSHMFRNLIPLLADRWRVVAPDYPGFGQSAMPERSAFAYTFDRYSEVVAALLDRLGVRRYAMYVMDYGAPVGWRLALARPESIAGLIVQNGNAYEEGLREFWNPIKAYWADGSAARRDALRFLVAPETTKFQYTDGVRDVSRIAPDNWVHDQALLDRPGNAEVQMDLFYDYRTNLPLYPQVQAWFRERRPPTLIAWGANDTIFPAEGAHPFRRDLPDAELHLLDTGHFALEDKLDVMAPMIRDFLARKVAPR